MQGNSWKARSLGRWLCFGVLALSLLVGCGASSKFSGSIDLLKTITTDGPALSMARMDDNLYVAFENGKILVYDLKNPSEPKRGKQVDAFGGPHLGMRVVFGGRRLLLVGTNGKVTFYDLENVKEPVPMWGGGKTIQMVSKTGPFLLYPGTNALYMTPGGGTSLIRVDLSLLDTGDPDSIDTNALSKSYKEGVGGGGIALVYDKNNSPVRMYVGDKNTGKVDIWVVADLERDSNEPKPGASFSVDGLSGIRSIHAYKKSAQAIQGWLMIAGEGSENDFSVFDLGRNWTSAAAPDSIGSAPVGGAYRISEEDKLIVTSKMSVWDFSGELGAPVQVAELALKEDLDIRDMVIYKGHIITAEGAGLRIYKYTKSAE